MRARFSSRAPTASSAGASTNGSPRTRGCTSRWPLPARGPRSARSREATSGGSGPFVSPAEKIEFSRSWLRGLLRPACRRGRRKLAAVQDRVITLVVPLEAYGRGEHVSPAPGLLEIVHPPIGHLAGLVGERGAAAVSSIGDRNGLQLVAIVLRARPGGADTDPRFVVVQGKALRQ